MHKESKTCLQAPPKDSDDNRVRPQPCNSKLLSQKWKMNLNDIYGPVPSWAKVADEFDKKRRQKTKEL